MTGFDSQHSTGVGSSLRLVTSSTTYSFIVRERDVTMLILIGIMGFCFLFLLSVGIWCAWLDLLAQEAEDED